MPVSVREVRVASDPDSTYFLRVDWRGRGLAAGFQLLLTDGRDAWRGDVSEAAVRAEADELEMPVAKYTDDLQAALTGADGADAYGFSLTPSPPGRRSTVTLAYEKVQRDISFQLGCVELAAEAEAAEALRQLLSHSLQRGTSLELHNQRLQGQNQSLRAEQQRIAAELKRYTRGKEALETELYSRFVLVLNEKKAKIRSLQETVTHLQETRRSGHEKEDSGRSDRRDAQKDDEYGGSTDEEVEEVEEVEEAEEVQSSPVSTLPSRESSTPSPLDDGLKDLTDVAPCRKRRVRHLGPPQADPPVKRPSATSSQRTRTDPPAGSSKQQPPQRPTDAAAEDLFEDF